MGRHKTYQKISERFYWKTIWSDVQKYVQEFQTCQITNDAKFQKSAAPLHPMPVKSKVWNQVLKQCVCACIVPYSGSIVHHHIRLELTLLAHYQRHSMVIISSLPWLIFFPSGQRLRPSRQEC